MGYQETDDLPDLSKVAVGTSDLPDLSKSALLTSKNPERIPQIVDDELAKLGWSDSARLAMVSNIGRENAWTPDPIFKGHVDPASFTNGRGEIRNRGIISWNGDRQAKLANFIQQNGGDWTPSESNVRLQARFLDKEMRDSPEWKNIHAQMGNPNLTPDEVFPLLQKYIKYQPRYESDNRKWMTKAQGLGLAKLPDLSKVTSQDLPDIPQEGLPDLSQAAIKPNDETTQPVPESTDTLQMQVASAVDAKSPRAAVLTTSPEQNAVFGNAQGFIAVPYNKDGYQGTLWVNQAKAKKLKLRTQKDIEQFVNNNPNGMTRLTGIPDSANVGGQTSGGNTVTTSVNGNEAISTLAPTPESVPDIVASHQQQFPQGETQLVPTQQVADERNAALEQQGVAERYIEPQPEQVPQQQPPASDMLTAGMYGSAKPIAQPAQVPTKSQASQPKDEPFDEVQFNAANLALTGDGKPAMTREQYQAAVKSFKGYVDGTSYGLQDSVDAKGNKTPLPATIETPREVGKPTDDFNRVARTVHSDKTNPRDAAIDALVKSGYDITPQEAAKYVDSLPTPIKGQYTAGTGIEITFRNIAKIKGDDFVKNAIRTEQAQGREGIQPNPDNTPFVGQATNAKGEQIRSSEEIPTFGDFVDQILGDRNADNTLTEERKKVVEARQTFTEDEAEFNKTLADVLKNPTTPLDPGTEEGVKGFGLKAAEFVSGLAAGGTDLANKVPWFNLLPKAIEATTGYDFADSLGKFSNRAKIVNELSTPEQKVFKIARDVGNVGGALPAYAVMEVATGGNPVLTFALTDAMIAKGQGGSTQDVLKAGGKGGVMGLSFGGFTRFGKGAADALLGEAALPSVVGKEVARKTIEDTAMRRIQSALNIIERDTTPAGEATAAQKLVDRELAKAGMTLDEVVNSGKAIPKTIQEKVLNILENASGRVVARQIIEKGVPVGLAAGTGYGMVKAEGGSDDDARFNALMFGAMQGLSTIFHKEPNEKFTADEIKKADGATMRVPDEKGKPRDLMLTDDNGKIRVTDVTGQTPDGTVQTVVLPKPDKPVTAPTDKLSPKLTDAEKAELTKPVKEVENVSPEAKSETQVEKPSETPKPKSPRVASAKKVALEKWLASETPDVKSETQKVEAPAPVEKPEAKEPSNDKWYHGTPSGKLNFEQESPGNQLPYGVHFTQDANIAKDFASGTTKGKATGKEGNVIETSVNAPNLFDVSAKGIYREGSKEYDILNQIAKKGRLKKYISHMGEHGMAVHESSLKGTETKAIDPSHVLDKVKASVVKDVLRKNGYDLAIKYAMRSSKDPLGSSVVHTPAIAVLDKSLVDIQSPARKEAREQKLAAAKAERAATKAAKLGQALNENPFAESTQPVETKKDNHNDLATATDELKQAHEHLVQMLKTYDWQNGAVHPEIAKAEEARTKAQQKVAQIEQQLLNDARLGNKPNSKKAQNLLAKAAATGNIGDFASDKTPMQRGKIEVALRKKWNHDGKVQTTQQIIDNAFAKGKLELKTEEVNRIKDMTRAQEFRADNRQQEAHAKRQREAGTRTVYRVNGLDLGKTAYDYAEYLQNKPTDTPLKSVPQGNALDSVYNEKGVDYDKAKDVAGRIREGSLEINRLDRQGERGRVAGGERAIEASADVRGNARTSEDARPGLQDENEEIDSINAIRVERLPKPIYGNASIFEGTRDLLSTINAQDLRSFVKGQAFSDKGLGGFDIPSQRAVMSRVLGATQDLKIRDAIVKFIPVDVVDRLMSLNPATQVRLHDKNVLKNLFAVDGKDAVSIRSDVADALIIETTGRAAKAIGTADVAPTSAKGLLALKTLRRRGVLNPTGAVANRGAERLDYSLQNTPEKLNSANRTGKVRIGHDTDLQKQSIVSKGGSDAESDSPNTDIIPQSSGNSLLSVPQARQTDTKAFKDWFKDSAVVDDKGEPLVVYHGTGADIEKFRRRVGDIGIHFGTAGQANDRIDYVRDKKKAEGNENLIPVYLRLRNPIRLPDMGLWNAENLNWKLAERFPADAERIRRLRSTKDIRQYLQFKGYDGVIYRNTGEVAGSEVLREAHSSLREAVNESQRRRGKPLNAFDKDDQHTPEYIAWKKSYQDYTDFREKNAEDSYIVFEPTQIKSAIGNSGEFDPNNPSILKHTPDSTLSPEEYAQLEGYKAKHLGEIVPEMESSVKGQVIHPNLPTVEVMRTLLSHVEGNERENAVLLEGTFLPPSVVSDVIDTAHGLAEAMQEKGLDDKPLQQLIKNLETANKEGEGVVFREIPHEVGHAASFKGAKEKSLDKRRVLDGMSKPHKKLFDKALKKWANIEGLDLTPKNATPHELGKAAEEIATYIADGHHDRMGLSYSQGLELGVELQLRYAQARINENPNLTVKDALATFKGTIYEQYENQLGKGDTRDGESAGSGREEHIGDNASDTSPPKDESGEVDKGEQLEKKEKLASLPATLRKYGLDAVDVAYSVYGDVEATKDAVNMFAENGIDGSIKLLESTKNPDASHTILEGIVYDTLLNKSYDLAGKNGTDLRMVADKFLQTASERHIKAGRYTRAVQLMQHNPALTVMTGAQKVAESVDNNLSDSQIVKFGDMARELEKAFAETQLYKEQVAVANKENKKLEKRLKNALAAKQRRQAIRGRQRIVARVESKFADEISKAAMRVNRLLGGDSVLKMVAWHGSPHTFDKFDISKIGTGEGAQAYGHGLYFTDKESIADHYRKALVSRDNRPEIESIDGKDVSRWLSNQDTQYHETQNAIEGLLDDLQAGLSLDHAIDEQIEQAETALEGEPFNEDTGRYDYGTAKVPQEIIRVMKALKKAKVEVDYGQETGAKYKVDLKPAEDEYLLHDAPFSEQSEKVQKILREAANTKGSPDGISGRSEKVSDALESPAFKSQGFSGLDVPTQRLVFEDVFATAQDLKVLDAIVRLVPVDVMNVLRGKQLSTEMLFHDKAVFHDLLFADADKNVSRRTSRAASKLMSVAARFVAENPTTSGIDLSGDSGSALGTDIHKSIISEAEKNSGITGKEIYNSIGDLLAEQRFGSKDSAIFARHATGEKVTRDKAASDYLKSLGIRGIKYLDGSSRGKLDVEKEISGLERLIDGHKDTIAHHQNQIDKNRNNTGVLPRFFESREELIAKERQNIADIEKKIDKLKAYQPSYNYVIFDDADVEIQEVLRSVAENPEETAKRKELVDALGTVGAQHLIKGLASDTQFLPETMKQILITQYGAETIEPIFADVYTQAVKTRDNWLKDIARENQKKVVSNRLEDKTFEANMEKALGRELPEELTNEDILDIMGVTRDIARRQRAIEKMHRYATGVSKTAVAPEMRQMILGEANTNLEAITAEMIAENRSPTEIYETLESMAKSDDTLFDGGYTQGKAQTAFVRGKEIVDQAKQDIKDHQAEIKQEIAQQTKMVSDAEVAEIEARKRLDHVKRDIADEYEKLKSPKMYYAKKTYVTGMDLLRNLTLSAEMSFLMRQGGKVIRSETVTYPVRKIQELRGLRTPVTARPAGREAFRTLLPETRLTPNYGERAYAANIKGVENHPLYPEAIKMGIDFSTAGKLGQGVHIGEEQLQSEAIDMLVNFLNKNAISKNTIAMYPRMIQRFDKSMSIFLDNLRLKQYERLSNELKDNGYDPKKDRKEFEELARRINSATARPNKFKGLRQQAVDLAVQSRLFLAPSYTVAKWEDMGADFRNTVQSAARAVAFQRMPKGTQRIMMKRAVASYGALIAQYALIAATLGALVSFDPDDDDFLKLKLGNYRYDLTHGNRSELKTIALLIKHADSADSAQYNVRKYLRGRLNIVPGFVINAWSGKDMAGQDFSLKDPKRYIGLVAPLTYMNAYQAYKQDGMKGILGTLPPDFVGYQANVYPDRVKDLERDKKDAMKRGDFKEVDRINSELEKQRPIENQKEADKRRTDRIKRRDKRQSD